MILFRMKEYGCSLPPEYNPQVHPGAILHLFRRIPETGPWQLPKSLFQETLEAEIGQWLEFLTEAEKGLTTIEENDGGSLESVQAFNRFQWGELAPHSHKIIQSVKRGFEALLSREAQEKLGITAQALKVTPDDIANTKNFVRNYDVANNLHTLSDSLRKAKQRHLYI